MEVVDSRAFSVARAREIRALAQEIADGKKNGRKRAMQTLPHHQQRRCVCACLDGVFDTHFNGLCGREMSTTPNKLPRHLRELGRKELEGHTPAEIAKTHRKHRRRPRYLMEDHTLRQKEFQWLETHIWHAKRFKMSKVWGFHIAKHPRDRSGRAAYKALKRSSILYDCSYERTLRVQGDRAALLNLFSRCTDTSVSTFGNTMFASGTRIGHAMLYHQGPASSKPIAPVRFLWRACEVILFVHPAASGEVAERLTELIRGSSDVVGVVCDFEVVQFDLLGPRAHALAQKILRPTEQGHVWNALGGIADAAQLPSNVVLAMRVADPRLATLHPLTPTPFTAPSVALLQQLIGPGHSDAAALWDGVCEPPESQVGGLLNPLPFSNLLHFSAFRDHWMRAVARAKSLNLVVLLPFLSSKCLLRMALVLGIALLYHVDGRSHFGCLLSRMEVIRRGWPTWSFSRGKSWAVQCSLPIFLIPQLVSAFSRCGQLVWLTSGLRTPLPKELPILWEMAPLFSQPLLWPLPLRLACSGLKGLHLVLWSCPFKWLAEVPYAQTPPSTLASFQRKSLALWRSWTRPMPHDATRLHCNTGLELERLRMMERPPWSLFGLVSPLVGAYPCCEA